MQEIFILRHGHAQDISNELTDFDRALTEEGIEKITRLGQLFSSLNNDIQLILSSPYIRAKQTAELFHSCLTLKPELKIVDFLASGSSVNEIARGLANYSSLKNALLVGHCPDLEMFLGRLIGGGRILLKKGSLAKINLGNNLEMSGDLEWLLIPKIAKKLKTKK